MNRKILKYYEQLTSRLLNKDFLNRTNCEFERIKPFIKDPSFLEKFEELLNKNKFTCESVYELCKDMLNYMSNNNLPSNFLEYTYNYVLNKSFPDSIETTLLEEFDCCCDFYIEILRFFLDLQKKSDDETWQSKYPIHFLNPKEITELENQREYNDFMHAMKSEYIYEMMKLNQEIKGYSTLDHICGVHHIALGIGRQAKRLGLPIELDRISGSAIGHDIGKYGCKSSESRRVPYLHYYYTDQWFKKHRLTYIGNIALNHSVWDLELENLSIESLILIYSDFRVKNNGSVMAFYDLDESFQVILNKLDNLDDKKKKRYEKVYSKLKDFENFLEDLGVKTSIDSYDEDASYEKHQQKKHYTLMCGKDIVENLKYLSINHNISLMHRLRNEFSLNKILEAARIEKDSNNLRQYIETLEDYSAYLTQRQKLITLKFLYDLLTHRHEDIRRQSSELIGMLIANFDENYRKEVPEDVNIDPSEMDSLALLDEYFTKFLYPDHKIISLHRIWIGHSLARMVGSFFSHCQKSNLENYFNMLMKYFNTKKIDEEQLQLFLLEALKYMPIVNLSMDLNPVFEFTIELIKSPSLNLRVSALDVMDRKISSSKLSAEIVEALKGFFVKNMTISKYPSENYLKYNITKKLELDESIVENYRDFYFKDIEKTPDIFLSNLKSGTDWVIKKVHINILLEYTLAHIEKYGLYTAIHFCNILKVSTMENVRNHAGKALLVLFPQLPFEQKNDVAIELLRSLEIEGHQFTKYIPNYLGKLFLYLQEVDMDEIIEDLIEKIKHANPQIILLLLKTIGITISNYTKCTLYYDNDPEGFERRRKKLIGILLNGLVHYNTQVNQNSFKVIGQDIFGSKMPIDEKHEIFRLISKKILTLISQSREKDLVFFTNSSILNHIYRFISDYSFANGSFDFETQNKIAFFPGTFDPFSQSHKEISKSIRDLGFEVHLAVDEFSWSKRTQPNNIRRNIINMSIADEFNIYLYPEDYPINIGNPGDLKNLKDTFEGEEVYIVLGSDVILNASAYNEKTSDSIHNLPHVIFDRNKGDEERNLQLSAKMKMLHEDSILLNLPSKYEDISSTQIRNYIDENRDISNLVDPLAQKYIYENGLYRREPQFKSVIQTISMDIEVINSIGYSLIEHLAFSFHRDYKKALKNLEYLSKKPNSKIILIRDINKGGQILGYSSFHWVPSNEIFKEFQNSEVSNYIRNNYSGRILCVNGIFAHKNNYFESLKQIMLSETLIKALEKDYSYAIYWDRIEYRKSRSFFETLELQGFSKFESKTFHEPLYAVNMMNPCSLYLDIETTIKEPFRSNPNVQRSILRSRKRLQRALTKLYPGNLLLSFHRKILDETLMKKICRVNGVPTTALNPRQLGPYACVPFGNILNRSIIPNTVTKSMHTEKMFYPNMNSFKIGESPNYLNLENQVKVIKSLNKSIILIDDLLHKGYRIKAIEPILKSQDIKVKKIIVGMLSGRGKELMDIKNYNVDSAYFIPKLKHWFTEQLLYPFIGGDTLVRSTHNKKNSIPSINLILPYTSPHFLSGVSKDHLFELSEVCIRNSIDILTVLENEYEKLHERKLTLELMGDVFIFPRIVAYGNHLEYNYNLSPTKYLNDDLEVLNRLHWAFT